MDIYTFAILSIILIISITVFFLAYNGGNYQSWMSYSKKEKKLLKEARKNLGLSHIKKYKHRERGKLLYKAHWYDIVGHRGLALYQNCIYSNFVFIRTGEFETREYDEINKITIVNVYFKKLDLSWQELQLDTNDYKVNMIDLRYHPKEKIIAILQERLEDRYFEIFGGIKGVEFTRHGHHHILDEIDLEK
jgi:uncharacterized ubiquitin-like protein YukD